MNNECGRTRPLQVDAKLGKGLAVVERRSLDKRADTIPFKNNIDDGVMTAFDHLVGRHWLI